MDFFKDIKPLTKYSSRNDDTPAYPYTTETPHQLPRSEIKKSTLPDPHPYVRSNPHYTPLQSNVIHARTKKRHSSGGSHGLWVFAIIACAALAFVVSLRFSYATITLTPKKTVVTLADQVTLSKESTTLPFETVSVDSNIKEEVTLTEKVTKQEKAKGTITLYNSFSTTPQILVLGTRFQSKAGLVYRLDKQVSIPGYTTIEGKKVPGFITATVTADGFGEKYNATDEVFSIIAFNGTPKSESVYAKITKPIIGGLDGSYFTTTETRDTAGDVPLLTNKLNELIQKQIPADYLFIQGLSTVTTSDKSTLFSKEPTVNLGIEGSLRQIVFPVADFKKYLLTNHPELSDKTELDLTGLQGKIVSGGDPADVNTDTYSIELSGTVTQDMPLDTDVIKEVVAGTKKREFSGIISGLGDTIESAELHIRPFWVSKIPEAFNRITIINTNGGK